jgi:hypothetical protein
MRLTCPTSKPVENCVGRPCGFCDGQTDTGTGFFRVLCTVALHAHTLPGGWTIGSLVAAVQRLMSAHVHEQQQGDLVVSEYITVF